MNITKFKVFFIAVLCCLFSQNALAVDTNGAPELEFNFFRVNGNPFRLMRITSLENQLVIKSVRLNRGQCLLPDPTQRNFPVTLEYSQATTVAYYEKGTFTGSCDLIREIVLDTNYGVFTWALAR